MTGQVAPEHALPDLQPTLNSGANEIARHPCDSKRFSDLLVRVEHDSKGASHGSWWQVLLEGCSHQTVVSMVIDNLAPNALVVDSSLFVLGLVDVRNALAMVPVCIRTFRDSLDLDEGLLLSLSSLGSFETDEGSLNVKSTENKPLMSGMIVKHT